MLVECWAKARFLAIFVTTTWWMSVVDAKVVVIENADFMDLIQNY
jgi:hypothetical protein